MIRAFEFILFVSCSTLAMANSYMSGNYEEVGFGKKSFMVAYPNKDITPGEALDGVGRQQVCAPGYAKKMRRQLTRAEKVAVYANYGVPYDTKKYQIDHLIPLSIGGSNGPMNLWPQPIKNNAGFYEKQRVAQWLHEKVCSGRMDIKEAQQIMVTDWHNGWHRLLEEKERQKD